MPGSSGPVFRLTNARPGIGNNCGVESTHASAIQKLSRLDLTFWIFQQFYSTRLDTHFTPYVRRAAGRGASASTDQWR